MFDIKKAARESRLFLICHQNLRVRGALRDEGCRVTDGCALTKNGTARAHATNTANLNV